MITTIRQLTYLRQFFLRFPSSELPVSFHATIYFTRKSKVKKKKKTHSSLRKFFNNIQTPPRKSNRS